MSWHPRDKVAVVTGASSGIGEATARRLAAAGATVHAVARRTDRLRALAEGEPRIVPHTVDVTDTAAVDALAAEVAASSGRCDALVNNAGVGGGPFGGRDDLADALHTLDVNLQGTVRCLAAFADLLAASAPSRVVNVASVAGKVGVGPAGYVASKFGMVGLGEALQLSWADRGITVSQVNPGFVETEGFPQNQLKRMRLGRVLARPETVADAILETLVRGTPERTVPRAYRAAILLRHLAPPLYRGALGRTPRGRGTRD